MTLIRAFLLVVLSSRACFSMDPGSEQCVDCAGSHSTSSAHDPLTYLASIRKISIPPETIRKQGGTTFFTIVFILSGDKSVVQASRRYSEFDVLRKELTLVPADGKFPGKQMYDSLCELAKSLQACVEDRRLGLEAYLNRALSYIVEDDKARDSQERVFQAGVFTTFITKENDNSHYQQPLQLKMGAESAEKDDLINEYYDTSMGIAFSMVSKTTWQWGGSWGLASHPSGGGRFCSIITHKQNMMPFFGKSWGLTFHITPESGFWKYFFAIGKGKKAGMICGGPGDGGSHTPPAWRVLPESMGKDYKWFTTEKNRILAGFKGRSWNEFITKGMSKPALAGIFHYGRSGKYKPSDGQMCAVLRHVRGGKWPIYAYDRKSLSIERYLNC